MPRVAFVAFNCTLCGVLVESMALVQSAKPHLGRKLCGPCKGRAYYAERTGRTVKQLRSRSSNGQGVKRNRQPSSIGQSFLCKLCGATFTKRHDNQKYCSPKCSRIFEYQQGAPVTTEPCEWCGKDATGRRYKPSRRRFCGRKCQMAYKVCVTDGMPSKPWPRTQQCVQCGEVYPTASHSAARCPNCAATRYAEMMESLKVEQACQDCGEIVRAMPRMKRCSPCKRKHQRQQRNARRKRRGWQAEPR